MTGPPRPLCWVLGRGGLLGASVEHEVARRADIWRPARPFSWGAPDVFAQITDAVESFADRSRGGPWWLMWCAGSGVVASTPESLAFETRTLRHVLDSVSAATQRHRLGTGTLFFASSAGGLYAGSARPPFDERSEPRPLAPYGQVKLEHEQLVREWAATEAVALLIGRIANLYGPGQNLGKSQGLISQLCWSQINQQPFNIYVPLGTRRDYLYAADCGAMVAAGVSELSALGERTTTIKVLASQRSMTIGEVLGQFRRIVGRPPRVSLRATELGRRQVIDLRLASRTMPHLDHLASTLFPVGLFATYEELRRQHARGRPSAGADHR